MRDKNTDCHHLIPKSRKDEGFNVQADINKGEWYINKHRALHALFVNMLPHEQIEHLLEINSDVIREDVKQEILEVLSKPHSEIYVDEVLKAKNETRRQVMDIIDASEFDEPLSDEWIRDYYRNNAPKKNV